MHAWGITLHQTNVNARFKEGALKKTMPEHCGEVLKDNPMPVAQMPSDGVNIAATEQLMQFVCQQPARLNKWLATLILRHIGSMPVG